MIGPCATAPVWEVLGIKVRAFVCAKPALYPLNHKPHCCLCERVLIGPAWTIQIQRGHWKGRGLLWKKAWKRNVSEGLHVIISLDTKKAFDKI